MLLQEGSCKKCLMAFHNDLQVCVCVFSMTFFSYFKSFTVCSCAYLFFDYLTTTTTTEYVYTHSWYSNTVYLLIFIAVIWSPFDEHHESTFDGKQPYAISRWGFLVVLLDMLLGMFALRTSRYFASKSNQCIVFVSVVLLVNELTIAR
jgi:hypothetical protein